MKVLVANRGEIALRLIKTCKRLGISTVAIYTAVDASSPHVQQADECFELSDGSSGYTDIEAILEIAVTRSVDAILPGYGFLSENAGFAGECERRKIRFIGPRSETIEQFGMKHTARSLAKRAGVPIVPGSDLLDTWEAARVVAKRLGFPVLLKSSAGGGGMGMQVVYAEDEVKDAFESVTSRSKALFSNADVFLEKFYAKSHHIEVQVYGDGEGGATHFGERECSIQRRNQKVIEESPSPFVEEHPQFRKELCDAAESLERFLEMNTRLQVEHGITELRYDIDLVELMILQPKVADLSPKVVEGYAVEARLYAENCASNYAPSPGQLQLVKWSSGPGIRIDTWIETGCTISPLYDPLLAKGMSYGSSRRQAIERLHDSLSHSRIMGPPTNLNFLTQILSTEVFLSGNTTTNFLKDKFEYNTKYIEFISGGAYTSIQDYPARRNIGHGMPQGGPMDSVAFRLANLVAGNEPGESGLELTLIGPRIRFLCKSCIAVTGPPVDLFIDDKPVGLWQRIHVYKGQVLSFGKLQSGCRAYIAIYGGFPNIASCLGSKATSPAVQLGGYQGRTLRAGDFIQVTGNLPSKSEFILPQYLQPSYQKRQVKLFCVRGPHDSNDFLTSDDQKALYSSSWKVSYNSNRGGIRLEGYRPEWSRKDGGAGGSHPSNVLDYGYPLGGLNWTGDEPVILPLDAPDLGGFICTTVIPFCELWRLGQIAPGDAISLHPITFSDAVRLRWEQERYLTEVASLVAGICSDVEALNPKAPLAIDDPCILQSTRASKSRPEMTLRQAGDEYLLVEYGPQQVDFLNRVRVQLLANGLSSENNLMLTPNLRALLVGFNPLVTNRDDLIATIMRLDSNLHPTDAKIPNRQIRLPLVFNDRMTKYAIERYMETQRPYAAYLPDSIDFIVRCNGLKDKADLLQLVLSTPYLVVGVGFLCGTPVALPVDPRARLVVPKYNPSRTFSPEGGVGIGGSFFCFDPVDAPGGYVNFGRTIPGWDLFCRSKGLNSRPWLFQNFDQVVLSPVSEPEYDALFLKFKAGRYEFDIRPSTFDVAEYNILVEKTRMEANELLLRQKACSETEMKLEARLLAKWREEKEQQSKKSEHPEMVNGDDRKTIEATMFGRVWKIKTKAGDRVSAGLSAVVLEAMKTEVEINIPQEYNELQVVKVCKQEGDLVAPGDALLTLA